jgi:hypothetical protein
VIPPNRDLSILHGVLHLLEPAEPRGLRLPIDFFFRSLAADLQNLSVGVILSGMGSDGTLGAMEIKEKGGAIFVQMPAFAKFDSMPVRAIDAGAADIVAPAEELAGKIIDYLKHLPFPMPPDQKGLQESDSALAKVIILLRGQSGHDFSLYKKALSPAGSSAEWGSIKSPRYLEPAAGKANWNLFAMSRDGLGEAFHKAVRSKRVVNLKNIEVRTDGDTQVVDITIQPLSTPESLLGMVMVVFTAVANPSEVKSGSPSKRETNRGVRITAMAREVQQAHEDLRVARDERQTSEEELKSTNEELQSMNEELQSTNEELTTSKEEMQSMNEELQTVNHELQSKVEELWLTILITSRQP